MKRWRASGLSAALLLITLTAACENAVTITGNVIVPPDVQALFSAEQPGKLELWGTKLGGQGQASLPYLCTPTDQPLVVWYQFTIFGCAEQQEIQARAFRVGADHLAEVRCGESSSKPSGGLAGEELGYGATTIFPGRNGGPCQSATTTAYVTLALTQ